MTFRVHLPSSFGPCPHRALRGALTALALYLLSAASPATAQLARPVGPVTTSAPAIAPRYDAQALNGVLEKGTALESQARWGDALSHYEEALRNNPSEPTLRQREDLAKLHWSLEKRYADHSFVESLQSLGPDQAAGLYMELLRKINAHYVVDPPWQQLAARGARAIDLGLADEDFCAANGVKLTAEQLAPARQQMYQLIAGRTLAAPSDLVALAAEVARTLESQCGLKQTSSLMEFVAAAAGGLDEYSAYLTADQLRDVYSQIEGNFVGLGVELKADNGALLIVHVIPGSPAERAGVLDNDRIVAVDGRPTAPMSTDEAASLLTGVAGSYVQISAVTAGQPPRTLTVRREQVEVPSLEKVSIVDKSEGVAYIRVPAFQKTTSRDLEKALWDLHRQGMRSLILDLRGNPGGLLTAAVEVADKFLQQGSIVSTRGRSPQEDFNYQAHYGGTWRVPLVVLIDGDSASASEIFAGAIKDNARGIVVGERSYGKGSVQGIFPLGFAGAGVRLTTALFYSPNGVKISHVGVAPDQEVRNAAKPAAEAGQGSQLTVIDPAVNKGPDAVLQAGIAAAVEAAKARVAQR